jgi:hypothetical protein
MSGRYSRNKGSRAELALVKVLQANGFAAEKISRMYRRGPDVSVPLLNFDRRLEVKIRGRGFGQLYAWLKDADVLVIRGDRQRPLVIVPIDFAIQVAIAAEKGKGHG